MNSLPGGTLLVSRYTSLMSQYKPSLEALGFPDVKVINKEKDALNGWINKIQPRYLLIDSRFYHFGTPYMMGRLLSAFPKLRIAAVTLHDFPDELAMWFVFYGIKYYIKLTDGIAESQHGLHCILDGESYVAPTVQALIDSLKEWPEVKKNPDKRQIEVMVMLGNGNSPDDIADCLHISRRTVDWHIDELKKVFGVRTREQLICMAFYLDIVRKEDMCFFSRKAKNVVIPKWAKAKTTGNYQRTINR